VHNALKFTPAGGIVTIGARNSDADTVEVSVMDTGIGIAPEESKAVFDEFSQVRRQVRRRQREGSGLGLAIARRIVEAHHGAIGLSSAPGKGSRFWFTLPRHMPRGSIRTAVSA